MTLCVVACATRPAQDGPPPTAVELPPPGADVDAGDEPDRVEPAGTRNYVGRLVLSEPLSEMAPLEICLDDAKLYRTARFRLGRVALAGPVSLRAEDAGSIVVARGRERPLRELLQPVGVCGPDFGEGAPQVQMRSDWVSPEGGIRSTWARVDELSYIEAQHAQVVHMHEVIRHDETSVVVRLTNPLDHGLDGLEVVAHYEGGPGKSMPKLIPQRVDLPAHGSLEITVGRRVSEEWKLSRGLSRRVGYDLVSIDLSLDDPRVRIDAALYLDLQ
jgi:hypothetical protein